MVHSFQLRLTLHGGSVLHVYHDRMTEEGFTRNGMGQKTNNQDKILFTDIAKIEFKRLHKSKWRCLGCPSMARYFLAEYINSQFAAARPEMVEEPLSCFDGLTIQENPLEALLGMK